MVEGGFDEVLPSYSCLILLQHPRFKISLEDLETKVMVLLQTSSSLALLELGGS